MNSAPRGACESLEHVLGILQQAGTTKEYPPGVWVIKVGIFRMPASSKMLRHDLMRPDARLVEVRKCCDSTEHER